MRKSSTELARRLNRSAAALVELAYPVSGEAPMNNRWAVNDDLENEFRYWLRELLAALRQAAVFAVAAGVLIALLPGSEASTAAAFARDFWPYLVEVAFWFGMFVAMAWSAIKRTAAAFTGVLPWDAEKEQAVARARDEWRQ